jgi:alginate O-acetyltransferase complex protein AlgI
MLFADAATPAVPQAGPAVNPAAGLGSPKPWAADWDYFRELHALLPEPFFQTQAFLVFCGVVLAAYWLLPRKWNTTRVWLLVVASFHFYAAWNAGLALLVTGTTVADYLLARLMDRCDRRPLRRAIMLTSVGMNLGVLCYFKYRGFFLNELHDTLTALGLPTEYDKLDLHNILIPFGISFYTFEAISYAVDVYRRKVRAETSLPHFMLFILFFPHLVAGPIVRAGDFLRQAHKIKRWNWLRVQVGVQLFLLGVFKKLAIADRMAVFSDPCSPTPRRTTHPPFGSPCWRTLCGSTATSPATRTWRWARPTCSGSG